MSTTLVETPTPFMVVDVKDDRLGDIGYVVIDRPVHGVSSGGVRMTPDVSSAELAHLARAMTYKWAFVGMPMGGAKAGIYADPAALGCSRDELMEAFGRSIAALVQQQVYLPGIDLGTTLADLRAIMRGAGIDFPEEQIDGSRSTSLTVFETIRQMVAFQGLALNGLKVALEGFGKVGGNVAELLAEQGAQLVAVSTAEGAIMAQDGLDVARLLVLREEHGDHLVDVYPGAETIAHEALFTLPVDLLIPGARPQVITAANVDQIQANMIVPIANAPLTPEAEASLIERGVPIAPDFVANCGGIMAGGILGGGFDIDDARQIIEGPFARIVCQMLANAHRQNKTFGEVARDLAWQNHSAFNGDEPQDSTGKLARLVQLFKEQDIRGVQARLAWRIHQRQPGLNPAIRNAARDRFVDFTLGQTLERLQQIT